MKETSKSSRSKSSRKLVWMLSRLEYIKTNVVFVIIDSVIVYAVLRLIRHHGSDFIALLLIVVSVVVRFVCDDDARRDGAAHTNEYVTDFFDEQREQQQDELQQQQQQQQQQRQLRDRQRPDDGVIHPDTTTRTSTTDRLEQEWERQVKERDHSMMKKSE